MEKFLIFHCPDGSYCRFRWQLAFGVLLLGLLLPAARADRSLRQQDPAFMYEKAGEYAKAALYWHRAMRGVSEVWIPFMWGDVSNAPGKFKKEYTNLVPEYQDRLKKCLRLGKVSRTELAHIEFINEIWMNELVEHEDGGFRASSGLRAIEAEKRGDFLLAEVLRRGQARFFRMVVSGGCWWQSGFWRCEWQRLLPWGRRRRPGNCETDPAQFPLDALGRLLDNGVGEPTCSFYEKLRLVHRVDGSGAETVFASFGLEAVHPSPKVSASARRNRTHAPPVSRLPGPQV